VINSSAKSCPQTGLTNIYIADTKRTKNNGKNNKAVIFVMKNFPVVFLGVLGVFVSWWLNSGG